jgi:hypothetical protein
MASFTVRENLVVYSDGDSWIVRTAEDDLKAEADSFSQALRLLAQKVE